MFKQIYYNNVPTQYIICDDCVIYNTKTHKNLYGALSNGYIYVQLTINGEPHSFAMHRLMAEYFIPNPLHKDVVHHINGDQKDNRIENLMWVTQQENCQMKINKSPKIENTIPVLTEEEHKNEIWVDYIDGKYQISNLGRIKTVATGYIRFGCQNKNNGYIRWSLKDANKKPFEIQAHRAIYSAFHPNEELKVINHINGNRSDNRLHNLENVTQSENTKASYYVTQSKKVKPIALYDYTGEKLINVYPSMSECSKGIEGHGVGHIRRAIEEDGTYKGFKFKDISPEEYKSLKLELMHVS